MAVMAGKDGRISIGDNVIGYIDNFNLIINAGPIEVSQIGKAWKEHILGARDWSGSLSGTLDYADAAQKAIIDDLLSNNDTEYDLELVVSKSLTLTGAALFSSVSITGSQGDKIAVSVNFQGTGALSDGQEAA